MFQRDASRMEIEMTRTLQILQALEHVVWTGVGIATLIIAHHFAAKCWEWIK